eukprot:scaffold1596_cov302-Pinguiococcus_pyrenoidosus.AAC.34
MISPTNREVDIGQTLKPHEYIGMTRREILDGYLRDRAIEKGATAVNALVTNIKTPEETGTYAPLRASTKAAPPSARQWLTVPHASVPRKWQVPPSVPGIRGRQVGRCGQGDGSGRPDRR